MGDKELIQSVESLMTRLEEVTDDKCLPPRVRYCVGTNPKQNDKIVNKRLFVRDLALSLDLSVGDDAVKEALAEKGYVVTGEQRVPHGSECNFDSIYYKREQ